MVRGRIYKGILKMIELTPWVRLWRLAVGIVIEGQLLAKLEFLNPMESVKDRTGLAMIEALEASGELQPSSMLIEPTPGNPGVASTMDRTLIDEGLTIANESAFKAAQKPAQLEGLPVGSLSCAAFLAALDVGALHEMAGKQIVVIVPSFAGGYLSTPRF